MVKPKKDPFLDALSEEESRPRSRLKAGGTRPMARNLSAAKIKPAMTWNLEVKWLPIPIKAALVYALCIGLAMLVTPLMGRLVRGSQGLDRVLITFAAESGVSVYAIAMIAPLFAMGYALFVYIAARRGVQKVGQSVSRGLLIVLLTWISLAGWATRLWCLPVDYGTCFSTLLIVSGFLVGGPLLLAGLIAGYWMGSAILKLERR